MPTNFTIPRIGVQLGYRGIGVLGNLPHEDLDLAMRMVADAGAHGVEIMQDLLPDHDSTRRVRALLDKHDLTCIGLHIFAEDTATNQRRSELEFQVTTLGCQRVMVSCTATDWDLQRYHELGATLDQLNSIVRGCGAELYFHPHDLEYAAMDTPAKGLTTIIDSCDDTVKILVDTYWIVRGGKSAVELLEKLGSRADYIHAKTNDEDVHLDQVLAYARTHDVSWVVVEEDRPGQDAQEFLTAQVQRLAGVRRG